MKSPLIDFTTGVGVVAVCAGFGVVDVCAGLGVVGVCTVVGVELAALVGAGAEVGVLAAGELEFVLVGFF